MARAQSGEKEVAVPFFLPLLLSPSTPFLSLLIPFQK